MNPLEKQFQSWTPRRPSPEIARRLFGPAQTPSSRPARRVGAWNWLSPVAACALTILVAMHAANRVPGRLGPGSDTTFLTALVLNAASSNFAAYSANERDENVEYNFWSHATHRVSLLPNVSGPLRLEREILNMVPTNR